MKTIAHFWLLVALLSEQNVGTKAEVFFGPTGPNNHLMIPEKTAIVIKHLEGNEGMPMTWVKGGTPFPVIISRTEGEYQRYAFAGPAELVFSHTNTVVSYTSLATTNIATIVTFTNQPTVIDVPAGKRIRFFRVGPSNFGALFFFDLKVEKGSDARLLTLWGGEEFDGPIRFTTILEQEGGTKGFHLRLISYLLTDDTEVVALSELGAVGVPAGSFQILIEKSSNLTDWVPIVFSPIRSNGKEFFRFRISR